MSALNALCVQLTRDLFAIAKFFYRLAHGGGGVVRGDVLHRVKMGDCPGG